MPPPIIAVDWNKVGLAIAVWSQAETAYQAGVINHGNYIAVVNECKQVLQLALGL